MIDRSAGTDRSNAPLIGVAPLRRIGIARRAASAWALLLLFFCLSATAPPVLAGPRELVSEIQELLGSRRAQGLRFSVEFIPLETADRRPSVSVAPGNPLIPASVTKLVTSVAALETLGSDYTFQTEIHRSGPLVGGILQGDLGVAGEGDPFLVSERLWLLAHQLRNAGLARVEGDLVIHASGFPLEDPTAASSLGNSDRSYAARPSGVAANFNCIALRVTPADRPGGIPSISGDPYDLEYLEIDADGLRTGPPGGRLDWSVGLEPTAHGLRYQDWIDRVQSAAEDTLSVPPSFVLPVAALEIARIRGTLPVGSGARTVYRRARYPLPMVGTLLRAALAEFEVEVAGSIRIETRAPSTEPWIEFPSIAMADLVETMNRYSSNFIANQLALAVHRERMQESGGSDRVDRAGARTGEPGIPPTTEGASSGPAGELTTNSTGAPALLQLADAGASLAGWLSDTFPEAAGGCRLSDGSGLSIDNRLTAGVLTALLVRTWDDLRQQPKLLASLPGPGEPGTLRSRFESGDAPVLWAKTGTLSDTRVSSLAGYFEDGDGKAVAFAMLLNADSGSIWNVRAMMDLQEHWIQVYRD